MHFLNSGFIIDIGDDDPENSFSGVPYDKGAQFAYYIETILGKSGMQSFIRAYIGEFTQMAINSPEMYTFYESWVTENFPENSTEILEMVCETENRQRLFEENQKVMKTSNLKDLTLFSLFPSPLSLLTDNVE